MKRKCILVCAACCLFAMAAFAGDKSGNLHIVVVNSFNDKPVKNAAVVLHQVDDKGRQEKGGLNLKTNLEGKTDFAGAPYGKMRVQVIAHGFQTYGQDIEIDQPDKIISIKLKRPQQQVTIYGDDKKDDHNH